MMSTPCSQQRTTTICNVGILKNKLSIFLYSSSPRRVVSVVQNWSMAMKAGQPLYIAFMQTLKRIDVLIVLSEMTTLLVA